MRRGLVLAALVGLAACDEQAGPMDMAAATDLAREVDAALPSCAYPTAGMLLGNVGAPATELSGLVASRRAPGVLWGHNDSGDSARIYAFSSAGAVTAIVQIVDGAGTAVAALDWEDLAISGEGASSTLWIGDIGDNAARLTMGGVGREYIEVYRFAEPDPAVSASVKAERYRFTYPDAPHDCEALFVDPSDGALYFVSKQDAPAPVYRARPPFADGQSAVLEKVGEVDLATVTGGDISSDGRQIGLRNYEVVRIFNRIPGQPVHEALMSTPRPAPSDAQAEAFAFAPTGYGFYTAPEGDSPPLSFAGCQ